jgi:hypothetical protein
VLINLIFYAIVDSVSYLVLFILIIMGFANSLFILAMLESPDKSEDKITGPNIFTAFMVTLDGHVYHSDHMHFPVVFGIFQIALTGLVKIMLLHLLVSILAHIHAHVSALYKSERLRTKCRLINENALFFARKSVFKDTKYIIRVESDGPAHGGAHDHDDGGHVHGGGAHGGHGSGTNTDEIAN